MDCRVVKLLAMTKIQSAQRFQSLTIDDHKITGSWIQATPRLRRASQVQGLVLLYDADERPDIDTKNARNESPREVLERDNNVDLSMPYDPLVIQEIKNQRMIQQLLNKK